MRILILALISFFPAEYSWAQLTGEWDEEFGNPGVTGYSVAEIAVYNGNPVIGGSFTSVGGVDCDNIAQFSDRTWSPLGTGTNGLVNCMAIYNGDLYVGGSFTNAGEVSGTTHIARWDGTSWHAVGGGLSDVWDVICLDVFDGELIVGGRFDFAGEVPVTNVARWNGSEWSAMGAGLDILSEGSPRVWCFQEYQGHLYAGGQFSASDGVDVHRLARWDGVSWLPVGGGVRDGGTGGGVYSLCVYRAKLVVGGTFGETGSENSRHIASWDGTEWSQFDNYPFNVTGTAIYALGVFRDQLVVGGTFYLVGEPVASILTVWNGAEWTLLGPHVQAYLYDVEVWGENLIVGGSFEFLDITTANRLAMWHDWTRRVAIYDVPGDQGGALQLSWQAFRGDGDGLPEAVLTYDVEEQESGTWDVVTSVAASGAGDYQVAIPTDDVFVVGQSEPFSKYRVQANNINPTESYRSVVDSAYSIDNLPPPKPIVSLVEDPMYRFIVATDPEIPDLDTCCIYRGTDPGFVPGDPLHCSEVLGYNETQLNNYYYRVQFSDIHGNLSEFSDEVGLADISGVGDAVPAAYGLDQNYPNPFNPTTTIRYSLPEDSPVHLRVYDVSGRLVRTLVDGEITERGRREAIWRGDDDSGRQVATGLYFYRLEAGGFSETRKMVLAR